MAKRQCHQFNSLQRFITTNQWTLKDRKICETSTSCTLVIPKLKLSEKKKEEHLVTDSLTQIINHKDKTVLIIEKDETMQRLMTDTLQLQYNILHIDNEDDAQKCLKPTR